MYYNKEIQIYIYGNHADVNGITRTGFKLLETNEPVMVDIQPYSSEKAKKDYGYNIETTKRMFCDVIAKITESSVIKYKNQFYKVQKIPWDDEYMDIMLLEKKEITIIEGVDNG